MAWDREKLDARVGSQRVAIACLVYHWTRSEWRRAGGSAALELLAQCLFRCVGRGGVDDEAIEALSLCKHIPIWLPLPWNCVHAQPGQRTPHAPSFVRFARDLRSRGGRSGYRKRRQDGGLHEVQAVRASVKWRVVVRRASNSEGCRDPDLEFPLCPGRRCHAHIMFPGSSLGRMTNCVC